MFCRYESNRFEDVTPVTSKFLKLRYWIRPTALVWICGQCPPYITAGRFEVYALVWSSPGTWDMLEGGGGIGDSSTCGVVMEYRFSINPETEQPHIHDHGVREDEVAAVLRGLARALPAARNSRMKLGQTASGRYLQVIYTRDEEPDSVFVITAYELRGKARTAYRRRQRRKSK